MAEQIAHGHLQAPFPRIAAFLAARLAGGGLQGGVGPTRADIELPGGRATFAPEARGTRLTLTAPGPAELATLRDVVTGALAGMGVSHDLRASFMAPVAVPDSQQIVTVADRRRISPNVMRLRFEGALSRYALPDARLHFRLLFSRTGADWPTADAEGRTVWPGGIDDWHRPPYTVRAVDPAGRWLDADIFLHAGGRVTAWCEEVRIGDAIAIHGPSGSGQPRAGWLGLVGDETAMPAILRMIEAAPHGTRGRAIVVLADPGDGQPVQTASDITLEYRRPRDAVGMAGTVRDLGWPEADRFVFFAGERRDAEQVRDLLAASGFKPGESKAAAYWTRGWVPPW